MIILADYILEVLGNLLQSGIKLLPVNLGTFTIDDFAGFLSNIKPFFVNAFSLTSHFFPYGLFFKLFGIILTMEIILLTIKVIKFAVNIFRGAGG